MNMFAATNKERQSLGIFQQYVFGMFSHTSYACYSIITNKDTTYNRCILVCFLICPLF